MEKHIVIDGNAFYEVDDACLRRQMEQRKKREENMCRMDNRKISSRMEGRQRPGR